MEGVWKGQSVKTIALFKHSLETVGSYGGILYGGAGRGGGGVEGGCKQLASRSTDSSGMEWDGEDLWRERRGI